MRIWRQIELNSTYCYAMTIFSWDGLGFYSGSKGIIERFF